MINNKINKINNTEQKILIPQDIYFYNDIIKISNNNFVPIKFDNINNVIDVCIKQNINIIFPYLCHHAEFLINNINLLKEKNIKFFVPDKYILDCFDDKGKFYNYMNNNGFSNYVPKIYDKIVYPCILKHKNKNSGRSIYHIKNKRDLPKEINYQDYVISEIIEGNIEYATHLLAVNGSIVMDLTIKHTFDKSIFIYGATKKPISSHEIKTDSNVLNILSDIIKKSNYNGMMCADYKIVNDSPIIFEINPRVGASLIRTNNLHRFINKYIEICSSNE